QSSRRHTRFSRVWSSDVCSSDPHLETWDLGRSKAFYVDRLGLAVTTERPGALFMSKGGYHHHVAVNTWGKRARPAEDHDGRIGIDRKSVVSGKREGMGGRGRREN